MDMKVNEIHGSNLPHRATENRGRLELPAKHPQKVPRAPGWQARIAPGGRFQGYTKTRVPFSLAVRKIRRAALPETWIQPWLGVLRLPSWIAAPPLKNEA